MDYNFQKNQYGFTPQQNNQNQFNTEFQGGNIGQYNNNQYSFGYASRQYQQQGNGRKFQASDFINPYQAKNSQSAYAPQVAQGTYGVINSFTGDNSWFNNGEDPGSGGWGDTQYGEFNAAGAMNAIGAAGSLGAQAIDANRNQNQSQYIDSGPSTGQSLVGSAGPWGAAISGVSELGTSALRSGYDVDEYGKVQNETYQDFSEGLVTGVLDPSQNMDVVLSDDYSTEERLISLALPMMAGIYKNDKSQEEADNRKLQAEENMKLEKEKLRRANQDMTRQQRLSSFTNSSPQYGAVFKYGGMMNKYNDGGGVIDPDSKQNIVDNINSINPINTSYHPRLNPNAVNYNTQHPFTASGGSQYYITPTSVSTMNNPAFTKFNDKYSYYTDPKLIPDYGNIRGANYDQKAGMSYQADSTGDTSKMKSAFDGKLSMDDLNYANGGLMDNLENNPDITKYKNGGTHESNPLGGIPIGNKGLVEEGEYKVKFDDGDFIFTNRY